MLGIITVVSIFITIGLFLFTGGGSEPDAEVPVAVDGSEVVVQEVMDLDSPPAEGKAKITGTLCPLESVSGVSGLLLTAERIPDKERFSRFIQGPFDELIEFSLEVEPARYEVFTETSERQKMGLYSRFVLCGLDESACLDHTMVRVEALEGDILQDVDVCDYSWAG